MVNEHRATVTTLLLVRAEHEAVEDELAASLEELKHAHCRAVTLEAVAPGDLMHRLAPSLGCELVALTGVGVLLGQQLLGRTLPFLLRNDLGKIHRASFA
jgi:hypothetical protein